MALVHQVDPAKFVDVAAGKPQFGRGAWTRLGIEFDYRYALSEDSRTRIGTRAEVSLDHWAVAAGTWAIQQRLVLLGFMEPVADGERGIYGPRTKAAVIAFQQASKDPDGGAQLVDDGTVGRSDARALFTKPLRAAERRYNLPAGFLVGETNHESALDPGAVGYYIYYKTSSGDTLDYRGVDRGMSQINSSANAQVSWLEAFDPGFSSDWSAKRLRAYYDQYKSRYPSQADSVLWDAALCAHNNPWAGGEWAKSGVPPTEQAKSYVTSVKTAIY